MGLSRLAIRRHLSNNCQALEPVTIDFIVDVFAM